MSIAQVIPLRPVPALDARGRRRSPASTPGHKPRKPPATKGRRYPPDPLAVEDFVKLLAACTPQRSGSIGELSALRLRTLIVLLWRTGIRISEALDLEERDLDQHQSTIVIRCGKGDKRRLVMMDPWGWAQCQPWLRARLAIPAGQLFCVLSGPTAGRGMQSSDVRRQITEAAVRAGVRRHVHAHGFRHSAAVEWRREGMDLLTIQKQLGHAHLGVTQIYLEGLTTEEILQPLARRAAPMMAVPGIT